MDIQLNEVWKEPKGFSRYLCSNLGRVKSKSYKKTGKEQIIKPALTGGYLKSVFVGDDGNYYSLRIHRLILIAFDYRDDYKTLEGNHKNGIKQDNRIENLEWCTRAENIQHCIDNNLQLVLKGEQIGNSILTTEKVLEIRRRFKPRICTREMLALEFGVKPCTIKDIILRRSWKHI